MNQNPVSCAGAIEAIRYVADHDLLVKSTQTGAYLLKRLNDLVDEFEIVGQARGLGMMCGIEFVKNKQTKEPFDPKQRVSGRFEEECMKRGLSLFQCAGCVEGVAGDMMLVTPPLIITPAQVDDLVGIMSAALKLLQAELL
jgi:adenosylmethionine-8-amino-7-oxononanoate aminotransferase